MSLGEPNAQLASHRVGSVPRMARSESYFAAALRRYSIEADRISTLPFKSSLNGLFESDTWLANALIGSVFARGLDKNGVFAAAKLFAVVVLAVPDQLVLARRAGRPRDSEEDILLFGDFAIFVALEPALQVREPLERPGPTQRDPEGERAHWFSLHCPPPRRPRRAAGTVPFSA